MIDKTIYSKTIKSRRSGPLFMAFSYPTKISPETIATYILTHTKPGDTVLDVFGGSGTTGMATLLCDQPNNHLKEIIKENGLNVQFGPRKAVIYELSKFGAFGGNVICSKVDPEEFKKIARDLLNKIESKLGYLYDSTDDLGEKGTIRHVIETEYLRCDNCGNEVSFSDVCVRSNPMEILSQWKCSSCKKIHETKNTKRVLEEVYDPLLDRLIVTKKRRPYLIYGITGKKKWKRASQESDFIDSKCDKFFAGLNSPVSKIEWGDLYRKGYHEGVTHHHHYYTKRNYLVFNTLWNEVETMSPSIQDALKLWLLSYNSSHSTLMTRVVLKKNQSDFVLTGAQSGVLYISSLPVEKNIFLGLERKIQTFCQAFEEVFNSKSTVDVVNGSSTSLNLKNKTIDYVFTDPPFGDYIPYSELNYLNEVWLGAVTDTPLEAIVSKSQHKTVESYQDLLQRVFKEVNRVLKDDGAMTLVFHSSSKAIWKSLKNAFGRSHFDVVETSVLDKIQDSFKQNNSANSVKGDPMLLLRKDSRKKRPGDLSQESLINTLITDLLNESKGQSLDERRVFSLYVNRCMESGLEVTYDAGEFYQLIRNELVNARS